MTALHQAGSSNCNVFSAVRRAVRHQHLLDDLAQDVARGKLRGAEVQHFLAQAGEDAEWMMFLKLGIFWKRNHWSLKTFSVSVERLVMVGSQLTGLKSVGWIEITRTFGLGRRGTPERIKNPL